MNDESTESSPKPGVIVLLWRWFWRVTLVVSIGVVWYCYYAPANDIAWAANFTAAQQRATESGRPMLLYFTGKWCVPCRIMKRNVWADEQVTATVNDRFVPVMIDLGDPATADVRELYQVSAAPVTMVTKPSGEVVNYAFGGLDKAEFLALIDRP